MCCAECSCLRDTLKTLLRALLWMAGTDQLSGFCLENKANQNSECLAACDTTSGGSCDNPNSLCEASYILGAAQTVGVCRPESFYQSAAEARVVRFRSTEAMGPWLRRATSDDVYH